MHVMLLTLAFHCLRPALYCGLPAALTTLGLTPSPPPCLLQVKAALRRLGSTHERLTIVQATCEFELKKRAAAARPLLQEVGGSKAATVARRRVAAAGEDQNADGRLNWLRHTLHNVCALLAAFSSTAAAATPSSPSRGAAGSREVAKRAAVPVAAVAAMNRAQDDVQRPPSGMGTDQNFKQGVH